ncbi:MAG TPA: hypothetical protein VK166_05525 [Chitinophagaceae bacterium]|nr:hypothetical protein [Chitinophagaceae bacterium]
MRWVVTVFLLLAVLGSNAQGRLLKGSLLDPGGLPVQGVSITVRYTDSSKILAFGISRADGSFLIQNLPDGLRQLIVEFRHISYETRQIIVNSDVPGWVSGHQIQLREKTEALKEVVIKREVPVLIRSDTVVFNANSYRDAEVRKVEDLLKKLQGFSVDPNGRLSFNGKAVEKVLIDGDDLANKAYQLITRNLDAVTVDKVEVINNFSDNRLLRNVEESNKVGVNLKISSRFKSKFSGGLEGGLSIERRYNADMNTIYIKERSKWLMFGSYNNVARDPAGNSGYYYQQEAGQVSEEESGLSGPLVLESGSIVLPSIGEKYTRDNSDLAFAMMNSWKIGKHVRLNGLIGYQDLSMKNRAESWVQTEISNQDQWYVFNAMNIHNREKSLEARVSLQRDGGKNHITAVDLILNGIRQKNLFSNWSGGAVNDSLLENLENGMEGVRLNWKESFLTGGKLLQLLLDVGHNQADQDLTVRSTRYLQYWGLDSSYKFNRQDLAKKKNYCLATVRINGKTDRLQYEYGIRSEYQALGYLSNGLISSLAPKPDLVIGEVAADTRKFDLKAMSKLGMDGIARGWLGISGEVGWETFSTGSVENNFLSYRGGLGYVKNISLLSALRLNYTVRRGFDQYDKFYPDELISGNGLILNGLRFKEPEFSHGLIVTVNSNNLYRQRNWAANFSTMFMPRRYTGGVEAKPEYGIQFFELTHVNKQLNAGFNWEGYLKIIKGKLGGRFSFNSGQYESVVNSIKGVSARAGLRIDGWWVSGFRGAVNSEIKSSVLYSTGRWNRGELNRNWQYEWSFKLKIKPRESFYSALVWHAHKLSQKMVFHGLDLYASRKLGKSLQLTLTGSNLLNTGRLLDKMVMPYSRSETGYVLVARYLLLSINCRF